MRSVTAIFDMLSKQPKEQRFATLLNNMAEFHQRFVDGYKLFAASFSFEKVRDQAESIKLEYLNKIHKTFSDIQGSSRDPGLYHCHCNPVQRRSVTYRVSKNGTDVAQHCNLDWCLHLLPVANLCRAKPETHTLDALGQEIVRHEKSLDSEYANLKGRFNDVFETLKRRACIHRIGLYVVLGICWGIICFWLWNVLDAHQNRVLTRLSPPRTRAME